MHQGEYIKAQLRQRKITQEKLGIAVGVSRAQIIKLLSLPVLEEDTLGTVKKILKYLDIDRTDLPTVDNNSSHIETTNFNNNRKPISYYLDKIENLKSLLAKEEKLNNILERENIRLEAENKRLISQLDQENKKRDPGMENDGSSISAGGQERSSR